MVERRQFIGHATAEANLFTGRAREITIDEQLHTIRVHDGVTQGGFALARSDLSNLDKNSLLALVTSKEDVDNKVSAIGPTSTDQEYPSARAIWKLLVELAELGELKFTTRTELDSTCAFWDGRKIYHGEAGDLYNLIADGQFNSVTFEKYEEILDEFGYCPYYGLDRATYAFRMPTVKGCYMKLTSDGTVDTVLQGIPNLKSNLVNLESATAPVTSDTDFIKATYLHPNGAGGSGGRHEDWKLEFNASNMYPKVFKDDIENVDVNSILVNAYSRIKYPTF